jgi:LacI family transcriptional regulator
MVTIYDVASLAGVSPATVSRVLNGGRVTADRERAVREAAEQLNYSPNRAARSLRRSSSEIVALIIPDIENPFFTSLARGVEDRAREAGYSVVLCNTDSDTARETSYFEVAVADRMAGVILAPASATSDLGPLLNAGRAVVAVDRIPVGADVDSVTVDNRAGVAAATRLLAARGFQRIACITGPEDVMTAVERAAGWAEVVPGSPELLRHADYRVEGGAVAMRDLLTTASPDAVVVANNLMGVGVLQALAERGLAPPAFGVAVFGDLPYALLVPGGVDVIHLPARELGETAASLLLDRLSGDDEPPRHIVLPIG